MVAPLTESRQRKVSLLREAFNGILNLLLADNKQRDLINMSHFKDLSRKVKELERMAFFSKYEAEKYTINSENGPVSIMGGQENGEGMKLH